MEKIIEQLLQALGENPKREGLLKTPRRVERSLHYLTQGYKVDIQSLVNDALFQEVCEEMVLVNDIDFYSLCEHHLLPFYGKCHVAYIPNGKIIGLSKIPRIVDAFARRLQVQERMTTQIAESLMDVLKPMGVAVITKAHHLCMMMRGVEKQNTKVKASALYGVFRTDAQTRQEFLNLVGV